jgi:hypothetical protein
MFAEEKPFLQAIQVHRALAILVVAERLQRQSEAVYDQKPPKTALPSTIAFPVKQPPRVTLPITVTSRAVRPPAANAH